MLWFYSLHILRCFVFLFWSHCNNNTLSCEACASFTMFTTPMPTSAYSTFATQHFTTPMPDGSCDRAMDLAFLLDGSEALSEDEFQATKQFILGVIERFRMGSAHTRATVLLYHSGVKTYDLQVLQLNIYSTEYSVCSCLIKHYVEKCYY